MFENWEKANPNLSFSEELKKRRRGLTREEYDEKMLVDLDYGRPRPEDIRPKRPLSADGPEMTLRVGDQMATFRQIGWHGATGAFYSLEEDLKRREPGSFSPIWVIAHTTEIVSDGVDLHVNRNLKTLRETLCLAQSAITQDGVINKMHHIKNLQELINECDKHRPIGPNGKHGDKHTDTCGCGDPYQ